MAALSRAPYAEFYRVLSQVDVQTGVQYTFGELLDSCRRIAAGLRRLGLRAGDIVGFHCVNSYEFMVAMCGTFFAGGVANMIKTNLTRGEVQRQLIDSQPMFVVCDQKDAAKVKKACEGIVSVKVVHPESRQTLGPNEQGEICVRGPNAFKGYLKNEIKTSEAYENGFVRTGDIGYYSSEGRIFVCGRLKELIKCMDQQVAPAELEELLAADPDVLQAIVVGVPHPHHGEAPRAFVVPRRRLAGPDEEEREADRLKELVAANLAHHKHLYGGVQFMDCLPQTGSYKDSRSALKELYIKQNRCANKRC
nr:uncharacterized protein LOC129380235 [Dermacentor andersoni]